MENEAAIRKPTKVEVPAGPEAEAISPTSSTGACGGLSRQGSIPNKYSCLCSPTKHAGSFRCRLHRGSLQRTKSLSSSPFQEAKSEATPAADVRTQSNTVDVQY